MIFVVTLEDIIELCLITAFAVGSIIYIIYELAKVKVENRKKQHRKEVKS